MSQENCFVIHPACVQLDVASTDWADAIQAACRPLITGGFVKPDYPADVIAREKKWATGLPTLPAGVAIPHALGADNVIEAQIAACRLQRAVSFVQSGGTEQDDPVEVQLIFILALKDSKAQLHLLQRLMLAISNEEMLAGLLQADTPEKFSGIFNQSAKQE